MWTILKMNVSGSERLSCLVPRLCLLTGNALRVDRSAPVVSCSSHLTVTVTRSHCVCQSVRTAHNASDFYVCRFFGRWSVKHVCFSKSDSICNNIGWLTSYEFGLFYEFHLALQSRQPRALTSANMAATYVIFYVKAMSSVDAVDRLQGKQLLFTPED